MGLRVWKVAMHRTLSRIFIGRYRENTICFRRILAVYYPEYRTAIIVIIHYVLARYWADNSSRTLTFAVQLALLVPSLVPMTCHRHGLASIMIFADNSRPSVIFIAAARAPTSYPLPSGPRSESIWSRLPILGILLLSP
jgi:hypothetical protein